ncbi:MAG: citramalate synthase [Pseudomonadota bacterium]
MTDDNRIYLFDTTLRDGQQTPGVDFTLDDKIAIAAMLDEMGVDYVEGGYPGANPTDDAFFSEPRTGRATFTAFGMTKRAGVSVSNDPGLNAIIGSAASAICFVGKAWDYHVDLALGTTTDEHLDGIAASIAAARSASKEAMLDCEHFFDGYKANPEYAFSVVRRAHAAGAAWVVLCDTNGGTLPHEVENVTGKVLKAVPGVRLGIHAHDDTGQAVANSFAAIRAGARQVQGTLNGIGERCGNANLVTIAATLALKDEFAEFATDMSGDQVAGLTRISRNFDALINRISRSQAPYVGSSAFATKAGIHASALLKDPKTYEHVPPENVGNSRRVMVSDQAGKSNFLDQLKRHGIEVSKSDPKLDTLIAILKQREAEGYAYETADASFEMLARKTLGSVPKWFDVESFRVLTERRYDATGARKVISEAVVKVRVDGELRMSVAEGNGPVNALDRALRKDLGALQQHIDDLELVDYRVRILNGGTEAITRVLIESADGEGNRWWTVGVSENIIEASFEALTDSIRYRLLKSCVEVS